MHKLLVNNGSIVCTLKWSSIVNEGISLSNHKFSECSFELSSDIVNSVKILLVLVVENGTFINVADGGLFYLRVGFFFALLAEMLQEFDCPSTFLLFSCFFLELKQPRRKFVIGNPYQPFEE